MSSQRTARAFLILVACVLAFQIILTTVATGTFTFMDHGFQLSLVSAAGFMTLVGLWLLKGGGSGTQGLPNYNLMIGFVVTFLATAFTMLISSSDKTQSGSKTVLLHPGWRLFNYLIGISAFESYVLYMLGKEIP